MQRLHGQRAACLQQGGHGLEKDFNRLFPEQRKIAGYGVGKDIRPAGRDIGTGSHTKISTARPLSLLYQCGNGIDDGPIGRHATVFDPFLTHRLYAG